MKVSLFTSMTIAAALGLAATGVANANAQEALAKSSGCLNCHAVDAKKLAPSFKDIAAKYKGKADAESTITAKLTAATTHPAVKASPDDVKSLVKWIVAM